MNGIVEKHPVEAPHPTDVPGPERFQPGSFPSRRQSRLQLAVPQTFADGDLHMTAARGRQGTVYSFDHNDEVLDIAVEIPCGNQKFL